LDPLIQGQSCVLRLLAISLDQLPGAPGCFSGCAQAKASIVESELAIRVKFENGAVSTEKNFAPAAWLARQMSASVIASPWQLRPVAASFRCASSAVSAAVCQCWHHLIRVVSSSLNFVFQIFAHARHDQPV
jgi:hypothetical protein